jgi:hypothetical protein
MVRAARTATGAVTTSVITPPSTRTVTPGSGSSPVMVDTAFVRRTSDWLDLADGLLFGRRTYQAFARDWPQITDPGDPFTGRDRDGPADARVRDGGSSAGGRVRRRHGVRLSVTAPGWGRRGPQA